MSTVNIPKLRFSEFSEEWKEKKLKTITSKIGSGSTPRGGNKVYQNHGISFIRSQNVNNNKLTLDDTTYISEKINTEMKNSIVQGLDILLNITGASIGRSCVVPDNFLVGNVNQHVCIIRLDDKNSPYFVQPLLASHAGQKLIYQGQTGSGREGLNFQSIASFKFILPSKQEQEKIASFLSSVDTKIEQLTSKAKLLQEYKKGVMQKIFSQEIRFKDDDGSDYPEWSEKKLGEVTKFRRGSFPQPYGLPKWYDDENGMPFIQVYDVDNNMMLKKTTKNKISKLAQPSSVFVEKGNIILTIQGSIGRIALTQYDAYVDRTLLIFTDYLKPINKRFFIYLIYLLFEIEKRKAPGGTIKTITKEALTNFKIKLASLNEQTKIANFLSSIDSKIEQVQKQLDSTKEFKKALLQQMFM